MMRKIIYLAFFILGMSTLISVHSMIGLFTLSVRLLAEFQTRMLDTPFRLINITL